MIIHDNVDTIKREYIKTKEAMKLLSCCKNTLRKYCIEYNIKTKKICGVNYYSVSDLEGIFNN